MRAAACLVLAGCYAPQPVAGSRCDLEHPCPSPLICASSGTCERAEPEVDAPPIPGCEPSGFDVCGDGIDQDCTGGDAACEANDTPDAPKDITGGGSFTGDLLRARDDADEDGCGDGGGRDLFFELTLTAREVYYFDTFGSNFDATVRVFPGKACTALGAAQNPSCSDDACDSADAQLAVSLPSGTSCVVVDQSSQATAGALVLNVLRGRRDGLPLQDSVSGNTCDATDVWETTDDDCGLESNAKDEAFWFLACPGETVRLDARTCASTTSYNYDTALYVRKPGEDDLDCNDDDDRCPVRTNRTDGHADGSIVRANVPGPGLAWLVVDGYGSGSCGMYTVTSTRTPL